MVPREALASKVLLELKAVPVPRAALVLAAAFLAVPRAVSAQALMVVLAPTETVKPELDSKAVSLAALASVVPELEQVQVPDSREDSTAVLVSAASVDLPLEASKVV